MRFTILVMTLALLSGTAAAQIGNPGFMRADTRFDENGIALPHQPNPDDRLFAILVGEGGKAEVALGELAAERASSNAVAEFGRRMVEDHTAANEKLAGIAEDSGIPLPEELNAEHQAMLEKLQELEGAEFDLAYMQGQLVDHQKTTNLLIWEIGFGQDGALQRFAAATLPTVLDHLEQARAIIGELTQNQIAAAPPPPTEE